MILKEAKSKVLTPPPPPPPMITSIILFSFAKEDISKSFLKLEYKKLIRNHSINNDMTKTGAPAISPFLIAFFDFYL